MRVLVVTNMYPPHHYGGYELSCRDVVDRWRARGHEAAVLTSTVRVPGVSDDPGELGRVRRQLRLYWDDHVLLNPSLPGRLRIERNNQRALTDALTSVRPDVVSVWHMGTLSLGLLTTLDRCGVPVVLNVCDDWLIYGPRVDPWTRVFRHRPRLGRVVSTATRLPTVLPDLGRLGSYCFVSRTTRDRAAEVSGWDFPDATVVYSGIDLTDFPLASQRSGPWRWRLLYVGRIDARKGIDTLLTALPLLPTEATLTVLGRGDRAVAADLRRQAHALGVADRVSFDAVDRAQLRRHYAAADVLVFPSVWDEPFGLVPLEAMASATPVVGTGRGGSGEYLRDGVNCLRYPAGQPEQLVAVLTRLATDEQLRRRLVAAGQQTAAALSVDELADTLERWHVGAASGFAAGRPADRPPPP